MPIDPTTLPAARPHGALEEVFPDVFVVRGSFAFGPLVSIARTMTVVRRGSELTILNSVRLTDEGEAALAKLGTVKHVVRVGSAHGADDAWAISRSGARFWAPARMRHRAGVVVDETIVDGATLPCGGRAFVFGGGVQDELAVLLDDVAGGAIVTADALQNWTSREGCSFLGGLSAVLMGFMEPAKIGPMWLKGVSGGQPARLKGDFERLLTLPFAHLIPGHGDVLRDTAHDDATASIRKTFG